MNLPVDLKKFVQSKKLKPVIVFLLCEAAVTLIYFLSRNAVYGTEYLSKYPSIGHAFYAVLFIIPLFVSGVLPALLDKTFYGTVERVKISTTSDNEHSFKPTWELWYKRNTIYLYVKEDNGRTERFKVYSGRAKEGQFLETYNNGDRVFHLYGSGCTVVLPKKSDAIVRCAVCGMTTDCKEEFCHKCGHTLPHVIFGTGGENENQDH